MTGWLPAEWAEQLVDVEPWPSLYDQWRSVGYLQPSMERWSTKALAQFQLLLVNGELPDVTVLDINPLYEALSLNSTVVIPDGPISLDTGELLFLQGRLTSELRVLLQLPHLDEIGCLLFNALRLTARTGRPHILPLAGLAVSRHGQQLGVLCQWLIEMGNDGLPAPDGVNAAGWAAPLSRGQRAALGYTLGMLSGWALSLRPFSPQPLDGAEVEACQVRYGRVPTPRCQIVLP